MARKKKAQPNPNNSHHTSKKANTKEVQEETEEGLSALQDTNEVSNRSNPTVPELDLNALVDGGEMADAGSTADWTVVTNRRNPKLVHEKEKVPPLLVLEESDVSDEITFWSNAVYCYILGAKPPWMVVDGFIKRIWRSYGIDKVSFLPNGIFLVRFTNEEGKKAALNGGHQLFDSRPMVVKEWKPDVAIVKEDVKVVPTWIRISRLELKFWGETCLKKIAGLIGKAVRCDDFTLSKTQLGFARVLIEVTIGQDFPDSICFVDEKGCTQEVCIEYEWKPIICTHCKGMGHLSGECRKKEGVKPVQVWRPKVMVPKPLPTKTNAPTTATVTPTPDGLQTPTEVLPSMQIVPSSSLIPARLATRMVRQTMETDSARQASFLQVLNANVDVGSSLNSLDKAEGTYG